MEKLSFDLLIVGAGPAGSSCAYQLRNENIKIALIDKSSFPRDKICGDALSPDITNQLNWMGIELGEKYKQLGGKQNSKGIRFFSPNKQCLEIPFQTVNKTIPESYIAKRIDFDYFLFQQIENQSNLTIFQNEALLDLKNEKSNVVATTKTKTIHAKMVVGADGAQSVVNKKLGNYVIEKEHYSAGLRQYYKNISGFHPDNYIELHYYQEILPGYFWIFPLPNGQANVGMGMLSSEISRRKVDLKKELAKIIENHPELKERFKDAIPLEKPKGFGIPIGTKKRKVSGLRFLLLGDAANIVDPLSGEGIGNAIRSGRIAAVHLREAFAKNRFDAQFNKQYDQTLYKAIWQELKINYAVLKLFRFPKLFNWGVKKANNNESIKLIFSSVVSNVKLRKILLKPSFYFKLLFK